MQTLKKGDRILYRMSNGAYHGFGGAVFEGTVLELSAGGNVKINGPGGAFWVEMSRVEVVEVLNAPRINRMELS